MSEKEITDIFVDSVYAIIQEDEQGVESDDVDYEENTVSDDDEKYVTLGCKISVKIVETEESKTIIADHLHGTMQIPPLVQDLLGKTVGDIIVFQGKTYQIENIL